jgi:two-component system cell cycle sensor histidine kinase PleC
MRFSASKHPQYKSAQKLKRRIAVFCVAIMAAICGLVTEAVVRDRNAAVDHARIETANLSAGFEEQIRGTLNSIKGAMEFLKRRVQAEGPTFDLAHWKSEIPELVSPIINILMIDANGKLLASSIEGTPNTISYSDREYFQAHRDNPGLGFFLGPPHIGRIAQRLVISATRRLETKDGHFAGVLVFSIDPELLTTLHQTVDLRKTSAISLMGTDGMVFGRFTVNGLDASAVGHKVQDHRALTASKFADAGAYSARSPYDGVQRLVHWRKVRDYPLIVVVGLGAAESFAAADRQASIVIGLGLAMLSLPLILMLMLNREISRRVEREIALDRETEKVRETNAELVLSRRHAEEANQAKSTFLANMSHEFRTPLNAILGFSEIIRDKLVGRDLDRYANYGADIHHSGEHLLNIVNDVLDVAKVEAGKLELREEKIEVRTIIRGSLLAVEQQAAVGGIYLTSATEEISASICGDRTRLEQIVINLLSNAIKFTPPGGSVYIAAAAARDGGLSLRIRDTGIGMSREEISRALELFGQVNNSLSRQFDGTGLGLPLAIQLTELHGGTLTIESAPGSGTTVAVCFPANRITWDQSRAVKRQKLEADFPSKMAS